MKVDIQGCIIAVQSPNVAKKIPKWPKTTQNDQKLHFFSRRLFTSDSLSYFMAPSPHSGPAYRKRCSLRSFGRWTGARNGQKPLKLAKKWIFSLACKQSFHSCNFWLHFFLWNQRRVKNAIQEFFNIYMIHVKELKIDQEKPELWGVGCQSPPDA